MKIADDYPEPKPNTDGASPAIGRVDAMLAYVAVTRAGGQLDRGGLAWIERYCGGEAVDLEAGAAL